MPVNQRFGPAPDRPRRHAPASMPNEQANVPNWIYASATVIWAIAGGLLARLMIALMAEGWGGAHALKWMSSTAVGLALLAATIQLILFGVVLFRAALEPKLRSAIINDARTKKSQWHLSLLLILGIGPFANLVGLAVAKLLGSNLDSMQMVGALIRRASTAELVLLGAVLSLLPALVEESLFRGLVLRALGSTAPLVAIVIQAIAFGVFHLDVAQGAATMILGLGFGFIAYCTGSLMGSMVAHAGYNLAVLLTQRYLTQLNATLGLEAMELFIGVVVAGIAAQRLYSLKRAI
jgi:membrane protease YdiL (CAAX protease family)